MADNKDEETTEHSYVSDNLLVTIRGGEEVFISTHGTFYLGSLEELLSFLHKHSKPCTKTTEDYGTDNTRN